MLFPPGTEDEPHYKKPVGSPYCPAEASVSTDGTARLSPLSNKCYKLFLSDNSDPWMESYPNCKGCGFFGSFTAAFKGNGSDICLSLYAPYDKPPPEDVKTALEHEKFGFKLVDGSPKLSKLETVNKKTYDINPLKGRFHRRHELRYAGHNQDKIRYADLGGSHWSNVTVVWSSELECGESAELVLTFSARTQAFFNRHAWDLRNGDYKATFPIRIKVKCGECPRVVPITRYGSPGGGGPNPGGGPGGPSAPPGGGGPPTGGPGDTTPPGGGGGHTGPWTDVYGDKFPLAASCSQGTTTAGMLGAMGLSV